MTGALENRLRKNLRHLGRAARRADTDAFRLYDADLPEYAFAVDVYGDRLHVQEYAPPPGIDPERAAERRDAMLATAAAVCEVPAEQVHLKTRRRTRGTDQYERVDERGEFHEVREGPATFLVNLTDYLDTGLFLDHRTTRAMIRAKAAGKRFLNLFCYTATATVHAVLGGAAATTSVDLSRTYLDWAGRNLERNGITGPAHRLVRADVLDWLAEPAAERFDLVFVDPPTFSNSKRMRGTFDVQRDHVTLLELAARQLAEGGEVLFSTNRRRFVLDRPALAGCVLRDLTRATIPPDFERNPRIHQCWSVTRR